MNKERFVQGYIEQQRAYLSAYGPIDDQCLVLQGTPVQKTDNRFGFDTPVLRPRKPCSPPKSDGGDNLNKHGVCHADSNKENEPTRKKSPGRAKRKKTPPSDVERVARLAERRERKRQKREIVKSPRNKDKAPKAKKKTHAFTPAAFALMHGFSASNVRKDRLILQSGHLGVFSKGKASIKAKVSSKKSAPTPVVFSELAFLNKPSQHVTTVEDDVGSERSSPNSTSSRSNHPHSDKVDTPVGGQIPTKGGSEGPAPLGQTQGPLARPQSVVWDLESQNDCPSDPVQSDARAAASVVLNLRSSHWFAPPDPGKMDEQAIHSKPSPPQPIRLSSRSHSPPEVRERGNNSGDDRSSSLHPSHSASQGGYHQQRYSPESVTFHPQPSISRLVVPSPVPDAVEDRHLEIPDSELDIGHPQTGILPFVDSSLEVPRSISAYQLEPSEIPSGINDNHTNEICHQPARTCARPFHFRSPAAQLQEATSAISLENDALEYFQTIGEQEQFSDLYYDLVNCPPFDGLGFCDSVVPQYEADSDGVVHDFNTAHDIDLARDLDAPYDNYEYDYDGELNLREVGGHESEHGYGSEYGSVEDIDYFEGQYDPNVFEDEDDFHESDQGELQNGITVDEDAEDDQPLAPGLFEGRALLLGFSTSIGKQRNGLSEAEVDVAKRLHGHWRPQRL